jgi:hypothetical protein
LHFKDLKKDIKEKLGNAKHKAEKIEENIEEKLDDVRQTSSKIKKVGAEQMHDIKAESEDLKRIYRHEGLIYLQTDAVAIVIRKLGTLDEFLKTVDKLTKEGYRMMHTDNARTIASSFGINLPTLPFGILYYFQHKKYIT